MQAIKQSSFKPSKGPLLEEHSQKLIYEDFVVEYIRHYMKEVLGTCDMKRDKFYVYESKLLKVLGVYLAEDTESTAKYLVVEQLFPLLLLVKRQILELSHPHLDAECAFGDGVSQRDTEHTGNHRCKAEHTGNQSGKSNANHKRDKPKALIYRHPQLMANYLIVISKLMTNNKHA